MIGTRPCGSVSPVRFFLGSLFAGLLVGCGGGSTNNSGGPTPPANLTATAGDQKITLSWTRNTADSEYHIYCDTDSTKPNKSRSVVRQATTSPYEVTGLTNGVTYYCAVTAARNNVESSAATANAMPLAATGMIFPPTLGNPVAGSGQIVVNWTPATGATSYKIYYSTTATGAVKGGSSSITVNGGSSTSGTIPGLTNGTVYYFVVTSLDSMGMESAASGQKTATPSADASSSLTAPTNVTVEPGNASLLVGWNAVNGASSYTIYYATTSGITKTVSTKTTSTTNNVTISGLTNNTTYYVAVTSVAGSQESAVSAEKSAMPMATANPQLVAPTNVQVVAGNQSFTVSWNAVAAASNGYKVYYSTNASVTKSNGIATPTNATTTTINSTTSAPIVNGTTYYVVVTAIGTNNQESAESTPVKSVTPVTLAAPTNISASFSGTTLTFNWTAATGVTGYNVYYSTTSGVQIVASSTATITKLSTTTSSASASFPNITNGTIIYYIVTSTTSTGESNASTQQSVTYGTATVSGSAQRGARLYDNYFKEKGITSPSSFAHFIWSTRAKDATGNYYIPNESVTPLDTFRCITCHGSDYQGKDGYYGIANRTRYTGFIGVAGTTKNPTEIAAFIKNGVANGQSHKFLDLVLLNETDVNDLASFIATIATVQKPNDATITSGNARLGEKGFFVEARDASNNVISTCASGGCHQSMSSIDSLKLYARNDRFALLHRTQFGHPAGTGAKIAQLTLDQATNITKYITTILVSNYDGSRFYQRNSHKADLAKGLALYTDWTTASSLQNKPMPAENETHPLWNASSPAQSTSLNTWKCSTCHGTDLRGFPNTYGYPSLMREQYSSLHFINEKDLFEFLKNSSPSHVTQASHAFGYFMSDDDLYALARFVWTKRNEAGLAGRLYDSWINEKKGDPKVVSIMGMNPDWANFADASKTLPYHETWSCASCHGWDYKGDEPSSEYNTAYQTAANTLLQQGNYTCLSTPGCTFPYRTGVAGILRLGWYLVGGNWLYGWHLNTTDKQITTNAIANGFPSSTTIKNHAFKDYLSDYEIELLANFIHDSVNGIRDITPLTGNSITGSQVFSQITPGNCASCHTSNSAPSFATVIAKAKTSKGKLMHKSQHGIPGTAMVPTNDGFTGLNPANAVNVYQYLITQ